MATLEKIERRENIAEIPEIGNFTKILFFIRKNNVNWNYFNYFKEITTLNDEIVSGWLNINSKTLRAYRKPESVSKDNIKEHLVLLISLYEHGIDVFETKENFDKWLLTENYLLDNKPPKDFLDTITGIKFIDDRLTAIEYGDNVYVMEVFKICREKYSHSLNASGASNRWNKKDEFVIYTGSSRSLSTLEMVAHRSYINISSQYKLLIILISDESLIKEIDIRDLPENWKSIEAYVELQEIGSKWYHSNESLTLKVPSSIIPQEYNYIINTKHPMFATHIILQDVVDFIWDNRLL